MKTKILPVLVAIISLFFSGCLTESGSIERHGNTTTEKWKSTSRSFEARREPPVSLEPTWAQRKQDYLAQTSGLSATVMDAIKEGRAIPGMTKDQVILAWEKEPTRTNKSVGSWGEREQCIFEGVAIYRLGAGYDVADRCYLYFQNGALDSWQISPRQLK